MSFTTTTALSDSATIRLSPSLSPSLSRVLVTCVDGMLCQHVHRHKPEPNVRAHTAGYTRKHVKSATASSGSLEALITNTIRHTQVHYSASAVESFQIKKTRGGDEIS